MKAINNMTTAQFDSLTKAIALLAIVAVVGLMALCG